MTRLLTIKSTLIHRLCISILAICLCLSFSLTVNAKSQKPSDEEINAVFLYNFAVFVKWPNKNNGIEENTFRYCVVNQEHLLQTLALTLEGESVKGHSMVATAYSTDNVKDSCQVLYIDESQMAQWPAIKQKIAGKPILSVSNSLTFVAQQGGMISLLRDNKTIRPAINLNNVEKNRLKISAKLMRISKKIN